MIGYAIRLSKHIIKVLISFWFFRFGIRSFYWIESEQPYLEQISLLFISKHESEFQKFEQNPEQYYEPLDIN